MAQTAGQVELHETSETQTMHSCFIWKQIPLWSRCSPYQSNNLLRTSNQALFGYTRVNKVSKT